MVHEKAPFTKEGLLTVIQERGNHFDYEYWFKLEKFIPERIKADIKPQRGATGF